VRVGTPVDVVPLARWKAGRCQEMEKGEGRGGDENSCSNLPSGAQHLASKSSLASPTHVSEHHCDPLLGGNRSCTESMESEACHGAEESG
jgi:hypothetical protein